MTESDQRVKILKNPDGNPRNFTVRWFYASTSSKEKPLVKPVCLMWCDLFCSGRRSRVHLHAWVQSWGAWEELIQVNTGWRQQLLYVCVATRGPQTQQMLLCALLQNCSGLKNKVRSTAATNTPAKRRMWEQQHDDQLIKYRSSVSGKQVTV